MEKINFIEYTFTFNGTKGSFDSNYERVVNIRKDYPNKIPIFLRIPSSDLLSEEEIRKLNSLENVSWK